MKFYNSANFVVESVTKIPASFTEILRAQQANINVEKCIFNKISICITFSVLKNHEIILTLEFQKVSVFRIFFSIVHCIKYLI